MAMVLEPNQLVIDGVDISSMVILESTERVLVPEIESQTLSVPSRDGVIFKGLNKGSKQIKLSLRVVPEKIGDIDELQSVYDALLPLLFKKKIMKLETYDLPGRYELVVNDSLISGKRFLGTGEIELLYLNLSGISYSNMINTTLTNNGNIPTPFILSGKYTSGTPITVLNNSTLEKIQIINTGIVKDDVIKIDFENEIVYKNEKNIMKNVYVESDFWDLDVGVNSIKVTGLSSTTYEHRDRWL